MALKLDKLSVEELNEVIAQAQQRKLEAYEAKKQQARARIDAILEETNFTVDELYGSRAGRKATKRGQASKSKKPPMFRNPDNPEETWSGYGGRKPRWFIHAINRGLTQEDLMVGSTPKAPGAARKPRAGVKPVRGVPKAPKAPKRR